MMWVGLWREGGIVIITSLTLPIPPHTHTHTHTIFQPGNPRKVSIVPVCPSGAMRREEGRSQLVPVVFLRFP